jgi:hypothetical protein
VARSLTATKLQQAMRAAELNGKMLARKAGVSAKSIQRLRAGERVGDEVNERIERALRDYEAARSILDGKRASRPPTEAPPRLPADLGDANAEEFLEQMRTYIRSSSDDAHYRGRRALGALDAMFRRLRPNSPAWAATLVLRAAALAIFPPSRQQLEQIYRDLETVISIPDSPQLRVSRMKAKNNLATMKAKYAEDAKSLQQARLLFLELAEDWSETNPIEQARALLNAGNCPIAISDLANSCSAEAMMIAISDYQCARRLPIGRRENVLRAQLYIGEGEAWKKLSMIDVTRMASYRARAIRCFRLALGLLPRKHKRGGDAHNAHFNLAEIYSAHPSKRPSDMRKAAEEYLNAVECCRDSADATLKTLIPFRATLLEWEKADMHRSAPWRVHVEQEMERARKQWANNESFSKM